MNSSEVPLVIGDHNMLEARQPIISQPVRNQKFDWLQVGSKVLGEGGRRVGDANVLESGTPKCFWQIEQLKALFAICHPFAIHLPPVLRVNLEELSVCDGRARSQVADRS